MGTIKSGWLEKQNDGILWKNWKRRHAVLYVDGEFSLYEKVVDATAETRINIKIDCKRIEVGFAIGATNLPKDRSDTDALFAVITKHKTYVFLAPSASECREWVGMLENARNMAPASSKVPVAPVLNGPPPAYAPPAYSQPLRGNNQTNGIPPGVVAPQYGAQPPMPQPMYGAQPGYYPAPPQPMYGQPMYGQPMYVNQAPQQQQQRSRGLGSTGGMLLAGGGGLLGGYMLGSMVSDLSHHHHDYGGGGFDHDYGGGDFDGGGFDF